MSEVMKNKVIGMLIILYTTAVLIIYAEWGGPNDKWDKSFEMPQEVLNYYYPNHQILYTYIENDAILYHIINLDDNVQKMVPVIVQDELWKVPRGFRMHFIDIDTDMSDYAYDVITLQMKETDQTFIIISHMISIYQQHAEIYDNQNSIFEIKLLSFSVLDDHNTVMYYTLIETSDDYVLYIDGEVFVLE